MYPSGVTRVFNFWPGESSVFGVFRNYLKPGGNFFIFVVYRGCAKIEGMETSNLDRMIRRWVGIKTPREISELTGVEPREIIARSAELFDQVDVLTVKQQRSKIMAELGELTQRTLDRAKSTDDEFFAGMMNAAVNAQREVLRQLEVMERRDDEQIDRLNALRVKELVALIDRVVISGCELMAEEYGLDAGELLSVFKAQLEIEAKRVDEIV